MRWTVDYEEDFNFISRVFKYFAGRELEFTMDDILLAIKSGEVSENLVSHNLRNISLNKGINRV
jgi:spore coat polysaccharide biosynthesis protein SpsF (cytidylyltransferase family)